MRWNSDRTRRHDGDARRARQAVDRAAALLVVRRRVRRSRAASRRLVDELGPGQVHHLAPAAGARAQQAGPARRTTAGYRAGSLFAAVRRAARPAEPTWSRWPGPALERLGAATGETINLAVPRGERDRAGRPGRLQLPARRHELARRRRPAALLRARQGLLRVRRHAAARRDRWSAARRPPSPTPCAAGRRARAGAANRAGPAPSTSSSPGSWRRRPGARRRTAPWSPLSASPGPTCGSASRTSRTSPNRSAELRTVQTARSRNPTTARPVRARGEHERQEPHDATTRSSRRSTTRRWSATRPRVLELTQEGLAIGHGRRRRCCSTRSSPRWRRSARGSSAATSSCPRC